MRIIEINSCSYGSTGKIATDLCRTVENAGGNAWLCVPNGRHNKDSYMEKHIWIGGRISEDLHIILSRLTGLNGCFSLLSTRTFIKKLKKIKPDLIHLHNLHNAYINLPLLFKYIRKSKIPVVWTLHDCWAFTGHCPHFTMANCNKWMYGCSHCKQFRQYPHSYVDQTRLMYKLKKKWFLGVENLTVVTPSKWLAGLVGQSFLKNYPVKTIHNGIDIGIFKPTPSNFKKEYHIPDQKHVILGVSFNWGPKKGLDVFIELSKKLDHQKYQVVLVGTDTKVDQVLPDNIISIHKTNNQTELAMIYTVADIFLNATREEVFGLVNVEANACGTPVIMFPVGGSPECISSTSGVVLKSEDIDSIASAIIHTCETSPFSQEICVKQASHFDKNVVYQQYLNLYRTVIETYDE